MKTIGVLGGAFNPPHIGHAFIAQWALLTERVDQVWFMPSYKHAFGKDMAPFEERSRWCRVLSAEMPEVLTTDVEQHVAEERGAVYTIDALDRLDALYPAYTFRLIVGYDNWLCRKQWKDWETIQDKYVPIVVGRSGYAENEPIVTPAVSSSEVRELIQTGVAVDHLVPACVLELLGENYREP